MTQRIKGTQDFLDLSLFKFIIDQATKHLELYRFTEISTPILEPVELFKRSLGLETDVVTKEMFTVNTGPEGEQICLRPEATASTVRAFIENGVQQTPWKVFSWGPMFRHERPQKGRFRQFHQLNVEIIGCTAVAQDVHLIAMLDRLFASIITSNSHALVINYLGCYEDRATYKKTLHQFLDTVAGTICSTCKVRKEKNILRVLDCKNESCKQVYRDAPKIIDGLCAACNLEWQQLQEQLELLSVSFSVQPTLVRGLDYYNKTVFEFVSGTLGAQNTFCGGGRYDQLAAQLGSRQEVPSLGAAMGIERLMLMLEPIKDTLSLPQPPALQVIVPVSAAQQPLGLLLAQELIAHGLCTELLLEGDSLKSMMRQANKLGATHCLILGADEQAAHEVTIKHMVTGQEKRIKQTGIVAYLTT